MRFTIPCGLLIVAELCVNSPLRAEPPSFNREVRPILAANCLECHGPDEEARESGLRLDTREGAIVDLGGYQAIAPGNVDASELIARVTATDPDVRMPPADSDKSLSSDQIDTLRRWIAAGAKYEVHWSFAPPVRPTFPDVKRADWPRNGIDYFILAKLEREGLDPSPDADRYTLVRRLYLDLIGLPPTPKQADEFVNDSRANSYERLVDHLLQSKHYGERWASQWLDLARYSDTNGYEKDRPRSIWPYRDWVIGALNRDLRFDQFTIEQLAGDMLPRPTTAQRIATGFHRNTMINEEGGIDPLEFRFYAMVDRVATTGTVWLGLTTGCAQCHSHKFDPISQTEYYRMMALLDNADEPDLVLPDNTERAAENDRLRKQIAKLEASLPNKFPPVEGDGPVEERRAQNLQTSFDEWLESQKKHTAPWTVVTPCSMKTNLPKLAVLKDGSIFSSGDITKRDEFTLRFHLDQLMEGETKGDNPPMITALRLEALPDDRLPAGGPGRTYYEGRKGDFFLSELTTSVDGQAVEFSAASHSYGKIAVGSGSADAKNVIDGEGSTGWSTAKGEGRRHQLVLNLKDPLPARGDLEITMLFERHFAASLGRFRFSATTSAKPARATSVSPQLEVALAGEAELTEQQRGKLLKHYLSICDELSEHTKKINELKRTLRSSLTTMIMKERAADNPRPTFRHHRGEYLKAREEVQPGLPAFLASGDQPANRLEFARWLVSSDNPLVARVAVNRAWQAFFGKGIVETTGDFGTQSPAPSHPDLLDWLACDFVENGWSKKRLHRRIVTSATYRQRSHVTPALLEKDPNNRLLGRSPRIRVNAEMVRDLMLTASGLLSTKMGGPGVYPPQPASVTALSYGSFPWKPSTGEDRYRRSIYTFKKRTTPFAAYAVFDAPAGENCTARRDRSITPLQALTLLNDEMFLEMARALAASAVANADGAEERATYIFRRCLTRPPTSEELKVVVEYFRSQHQRLSNGELDAAAVVKAENGSPDRAAWVLTSRSIMNLDETITKE